MKKLLFIIPGSKLLALGTCIIPTRPFRTKSFSNNFDLSKHCKDIIQLNGLESPMWHYNKQISTFPNKQFTFFANKFATVHDSIKNLVFSKSLIKALTIVFVYARSSPNFAYVSFIPGLLKVMIRILILSSFSGYDLKYLLAVTHYD